MLICKGSNCVFVNELELASFGKNVLKIILGCYHIKCILSSQVNDINFENMSNDDAVRVLREIVHKPG